LSFHRRRGLSVLRRPAHRRLGFIAASNTLSLRAASHLVSASRRLTTRASGTASPPLRSNVRRQKNLLFPLVKFQFESQGVRREAELRNSQRTGALQRDLAPFDMHDLIEQEPEQEQEKSVLQTAQSAAGRSQINLHLAMPTSFWHRLCSLKLPPNHSFKRTRLRRSA
jgi:hypothetical protein